VLRETGNKSMKESPLKFLAFALILFEGVLVVVASSAPEDMQKYIVITLIAIPVVVLGAFFYLLSYQTHKLYAPSDFSGESSFINLAASAGSDESLFRKNAQKITDTASSKIRDIVAAQIETLSVYHDLIINNARRSFQSAFASAIVGIIFLVVSVSFVLLGLSRDASIISTISGALVEVIAGVNFYLYCTKQDRHICFTDGED
tara:strand:- start:229 stop:840 length:612 start_codon:yes stop_codon:yes gene_type:complete